MATFLKVPRRVHNALLIVTALAEQQDGGFVPLAAIAAKGRVSQGFLEEVASSLRGAGLIKGRRGAGGGYALTRDAASISIGDVITAIEGPHALPDGSRDDRVTDALSSHCASWSVWTAVGRSVAATLRGMTLDDVVTAKRAASRS